MPTGYTAPLYEGKDITFEQFVLRCSRAMGAAIMQRDEHPDVEIRLREVSDYEQRRVDEARAALDDAQSRTDEEWAAQQAARIKEATKVRDEWIERTDGIHERYQAMRRKVVAWVPPTEEHDGLKKFMLDQLDESEKFDVGSPTRRWMPVPEELPVDVYKANELSHLADEFARAARHLAEEHERVRSQNAWVTALRDSLREQTKVALFVRDLDGFTGHAKLFKLDPPIERRNWDGEAVSTHDFVVVSATVAMFSGPETYIFPADADGDVIDWGELEGSFKGDLDHERALRGAGYEVGEAMVISETAPHKAVTS